LPVVGVAFAAAAMAVNSMTARLKHPICHGCGEVLGNAPAGSYGVVCPSCGSLSQARFAAGARAERDDEIA
jgi:rRNA maturation endonuclease Nob1